MWSTEADELETEAFEKKTFRHSEMWKLRESEIGRFFPHPPTPTQSTKRWWAEGKKENSVFFGTMKPTRFYSSPSPPFVPKAPHGRVKVNPKQLPQVDRRLHSEESSKVAQNRKRYK